MSIARLKSAGFAIVSLATSLLASSQISQAAKVSLARPLLPLTFEENRGQADKRVKFIARGRSQTLFLTPKSILLRFANGASQLDLRLRNARPDASLGGLGALPGKVNYFIGSDSSRWRRDIPTYEKVAYQDVYPGIDLIFYGKEGRLEYDFVLAPRSNAESIAFESKFSSPDSAVTVGKDGDLLIRSANGEIRFLRPTAYQLRPGGARTVVSCRFNRQDNGRIGFKLGDYDHTRTLVIDPVLTYSSYFGGSDDEGMFGIQRDIEGNLYVSGETSSLNFAVDNGAQPVKGGDYDGFIAKFNRDATRLIYSTYLGGSKYDHCVGLAVDVLGNAYVAGLTYSPDFPTRNAIQDSLKGQANGFVARLDPSGSQLVFSTYLGGSRYDSPSDIAIDRESNVYVDGFTGSLDFPVTNGAFQSGCDKGAFPGSCIGDAFVTKMDARGSRLIYSTYLGGSGRDSAAGLAVDFTGAAYVAGQTGSANFPVIDAFQPALAGKANGFITKLSPTGARAIYSTYLGGSNFDSVNGIALDLFGNAYVTGSTSSLNFPTVGPFQAKNNGGFGDGFISKLDRTGSDLIYSTYLGGSGWDLPLRIAVDLFGSATVIGFTASIDFPVQDAIQPKFAGGFSDAFITKVSRSGRRPVYSTYLGGTGDEYGYAIHSDLLGSVWVGGSTSSTDYPVTGAYQPKYGGGPYDAFLSRISVTLFEELDALQALTEHLPEKDVLTTLLTDVRLSIGSGPAGLTLNALRKLDDQIQQQDQRAEIMQLHTAIGELTRQVRTTGNGN
ncbi:MAG: SBBP repeat-containing protein [Acidobacteriota bacterium]|nr:SBBP repeat-containing protein [Acidobacteriota bacterium]MDQ2839811.1 SBBP repeat-containing protein [Acidobacteriota bacterium]